MGNQTNFQDVRYSTSLDFSDPSKVGITDVEGWSGGPSSPQAGYLAMPTTTDSLKNLRLSSSHSLQWGPVIGVKFGVNLSDRDKRRTSDEYRLTVRGTDPYAVAQMPSPGRVIASYSGVPIASFDPTGTDQTILQRVSKVDEPIRVKFWDVQEKVTTAFVKADLDTEVRGMNLHGNVGVQFVNTDQRGGGYVVDKSRCTGNTADTCPANYVHGGKKYDDVLPSLNLALDMGNDYVARFGAARVLARPVMNDLRAGMSFGLEAPSADVPDGRLSGGGGDPQLNPFRADAFDISLEKYFGNKGVISLAYFYKDLKSYILNIARPYDFRDSVTASTPLPLNGSTVGVMNSPFNGNGGSIKGVEVNVDLPFNLLTPALNGFGLQVNHSDTKSALTLPVISVNGVDLGGFPIPMPGLSRKVTNTKLYYEAHGFQFGIAMKQRSDFLGEIRDYEDTRKLAFVMGETIIDMQAAYEFQSGPFKGLNINFAAQNLGNEEFRRYVPEANGTKRIVESVKYGKTYWLGASYKF